jgi:hypothetical protein
MVFLMAAIIALMLYQQLPRVAFESEREKEQLLIDRGEQYTRAIQLYYLANNRRYPTSIDDLEKREKRFLRRRYVDPYTGKDEWRIIHTNGGFLTDSLVQKPPTAGDGQSQSAGNTSGNTSATAASPDQPPQVNAAVLQRPSDRPVTPPGFGQTIGVQDPTGQPVNTPLPPITLQPQQGALPPITLQPGTTNQPGGLPPITLTPIGPAGGPQVPGQTPTQIFGPNVPQIPGQIPPQIPGQTPGQLRTTTSGGPGGLPGGFPTGVPPGFRIDTNGQLVPNAPVTTGIPGQPQGIPSQPFSPQPANQPANQLVNQPGAGSPNGALNAINQLLTNPRQTTTTAQPVISNQIGAIAGIASTHTGPSIKVYKDQTQYELWEFVFSPTASTVPGGGVGATPGAPGGGLPPGGLNQPGGGGQPGGFGAGPGGLGGTPGGFGGGPGGQPVFGTAPGPGPGR